MLRFRDKKPWLIFLLSLGLAACADYGILDGKRCDENQQCAPGYVCDTLSDTCVRSLGDGGDGSDGDAGVDGGDEVDGGDGPSLPEPIVAFAFEEIPASDLVRDRAGLAPNVALWPDDSRDPLGLDYDAGRVLLFGGRLQSTPQSSRKLAEAFLASSSFSLEVWCGTDEGMQVGPARILGISAGPSARGLVLGQDGQDLVVWLRTAATEPDGQDLELRYAIFDQDLRRHLVLVYDGSTGQETLYVDSSPIASALHSDGQGEPAALNWDDGNLLFGIGDGFGEAFPWIGYVDQVRIWDLALDSQQVQAAFGQTLIE